MTTIIHCGAEFDLSHLADSFQIVRWQCADGIERAFSVRVTYSNHCYSDAALPQTPGAFILNDKGTARVFCTRRHAWSGALPGLVSGLLDKPTSTVGLTNEGNWSKYCLYVAPPAAAGEMYYLFFRLRRTSVQLDGDYVPITMSVESAYSRLRVGVKMNAPFGKALDLANS